MEYHVIRLENFVKTLMNQNHVLSSSISKIAESLKNGTLEIYVDSVQRRFVFKYVGVNNPVSIDPFKKEILNVELLNGVRVENLVGGITNGYGIIVEEDSKGIYKIRVDESIIALKSEVADVEGKFSDYTTTVDLEANYATKKELNTVDEKFNNYTTTFDLDENYLKKTYTEAVDEMFKNYPTNKHVDDIFAKKLN